MSLLILFSLKTLHFIGPCMEVYGNRYFGIIGPPTFFAILNGNIGPTTSYSEKNDNGITGPTKQISIDDKLKTWWLLKTKNQHYRSIHTILSSYRPCLFGYGNLGIGFSRTTTQNTIDIKTKICRFLARN